MKNEKTYTRPGRKRENEGSKLSSSLLVFDILYSVVQCTLYMIGKQGLEELELD